MRNDEDEKGITYLVLDGPRGFRLMRIEDAAGFNWRYALKLLVLVAGLIAGALYLQGPDTPAVAGPANPTDQILVKFKSNASQAAIDALNASNAVQQVDAIPALGIKVLKVPPGKSAETVVAAYKRNANVQFAELNALVKPEAIPNDPNYGTAWHLAKIQAPTAWDSTKATGVLIAICDTGVASVADLTPVLRGDLGWNAVDGSSNWAPIAGHGTLVAGAAAAATNNGVGVSGVAWGAQIIPVRITNTADGNAYVSDAAKCINYAADKGAKVINLSYRMAGYASIDSAGQYAQNKGAVTVVAAGNDATNPGWVNYSGFLAVSATDSLDLKASWSNYGPFVDVTAPGVNIWTTRQDGTFWTASGTSLSAPVVSGVLGLIFGAKPGLSAAQAQSLLLTNTDDLGAAGWDQSFGYGRVNANKAVAAALGSSASSPTPTASPTATATASATATPIATSTPKPTTGDTTPPSVKLTKPGVGQTIKANTTISGSASDNVGVTKVEVYVDGVLLKTFTSGSFSTNWNTRKVANGTHTVTSKAFDAAGNSSVDSRSVTVTN